MALGRRATRLETVQIRDLKGYSERFSFQRRFFVVTWVSFSVTVLMCRFSMVDKAETALTLSQAIIICVGMSSLPTSKPMPDVILGCRL